MTLPPVKPTNPPIRSIDFSTGMAVVKTATQTFTFPIEPATAKPPADKPPVVVPPVVVAPPIVVAPPVQPPGDGPVPLGWDGASTLLVDATFGRTVAGGTVRERSDMWGQPKSLAYPWYIYNGAEKDSSRTVPNGIWRGAIGDGADGLYGNYRSRHGYFAENTPQDLHVLGDEDLTLRAWGGLNDGNPDNCGDGQIVSGILRFHQPLRPGCFLEISCDMPDGMYAWPAFWLNGPGEQGPWQADGTPGKRIGPFSWKGENDIFDQFGFNGQRPGHYLIGMTPTPSGDAAHAMPGQTKPHDFKPPTFSEIPGVITWRDSGWYAKTIENQCLKPHTYGLHWGKDGVQRYYFDGYNYRTRGYVWPANSLPAHLIASLQIGPKFNDLSKITPQGGVPNGWDWKIKHIRMWNT